MKKQTTMLEFKQMLAEKWGVAVERQRFWMWATRQNRSVRPSTPLLGPNEDALRVCDIRVRSLQLVVKGVDTLLEIYR